MKTKKEIKSIIRNLDPLEAVKKAGWNHIYNERHGIAGVCLRTGNLVGDYEYDGAYFPDDNSLYVEIFSIHSSEEGIHDYEPEDLLTSVQLEKFYSFLGKLEETSEEGIDEEEALEEFIEKKTQKSFDKRLDEYIKHVFIDTKPYEFLDWSKINMALDELYDDEEE